MNQNIISARGLFQRVQSFYVLPLARGIYLLIALLSLLSIIVGVVYLIFLQASLSVKPDTVAVPPPYQDVGLTQNATIDLSIVDKHLAPPQNIRFIVTLEAVSAPIDPGDFIGYFEADTPNGLADFPNGISIIGGRDADFFERAYDPRNERIGMQARSALSLEVAEELRGINAVKQRTFEVKVMARDPYGIASPPTDIAFTLVFKPESTEFTATPQEAQEEQTELQQLARKIAYTVEPIVNSAHFAAYNKAFNVPVYCGAGIDNDVFVSNYSQAFEREKSRLSASNVEAFYIGVCNAWMNAVARETQRIKREMDAREQARQEALAYNASVEQQYAQKVISSKLKMSMTAIVIGSALVAFLFVSIILAFMAMEGHSRAIRAAIDFMANGSQQGGNP